MEEARGLLNRLQNWKVKHGRRNLSGATYSLTKEALSGSVEKVLIDKVTNCI
jgi:hypothetical protein